MFSVTVWSRLLHQRNFSSKVPLYIYLVRGLVCTVSVAYDDGQPQRINQKLPRGRKRETETDTERQREKTHHFFRLVGLASVVKRKEDLCSTIPLSIVTSFSLVPIKTENIRKQKMLFTRHEKRTHGRCTGQH